jgi:hypothetical protein
MKKDGNFSLLLIINRRNRINKQFSLEKEVK